MRRSAAIIYIILLAILAGLYYYLNNRPEPADVDASIPTSTQTEYLFGFEDGLPVGIRIESKDGDIVEVVRNAENVWSFLHPIEASADQGLVDDVAGQITTLRVIDHVPGLPVDAVGLDNPQFTITIQFTNDVERIIEIGVLTPTESGYYVRRGDGEILIISSSAVDALIELLADPPFLVAETPLPTTPQADSSQ